MKPVPDQVVLVTGATAGLGRTVAADLAGAGATVLLHGRSDERGEQVLREIREETGNDRLRFYRADLASLDQVRALARQVLEAEPRLDALVNNAGLGTTLPGGDDGRHESADGHELRFAVNYLAPYLLTRQLLPLIGRSAPARIVNVSSVGQMAIDFDDVMLEHDYSGVRAYCQSKLAQVMFTVDLADELRSAGVAVNCLHPATYMATNMVANAGVTPHTTVREGADATVRLVADPALDDVTGQYFNGQREARADAQAYDADARRQLRELSDRLTTE